MDQQHGLAERHGFVFERIEQRPEGSLSGWRPVEAGIRVKGHDDRGRRLRGRLRERLVHPSDRGIEPPARLLVVGVVLAGNRRVKFPLPTM